MFLSKNGYSKIANIKRIACVYVCSWWAGANKNNISNIIATIIHIKINDNIVNLIKI